MSKRTQDEVSAELVFQMQDKLRFQKEKEEEEKMYAKMWEADMMAKVGNIHICKDILNCFHISMINQVLSMSNGLVMRTQAQVTSNVVEVR